ncbi:glycosyltransferase [Rossellomorea aquimaris]|uniref:CgeB family protein n=1 Tax=Rossellomorea aquimaris TaxID=189382 RepID=UPI0011E8E9BC|nr:glycosyltransferase [Rossellomorea aquimaris]TYS85239.1 glycosyltransferase [Rossellomorea aquimaris]
MVKMVDLKTGVLSFQKEILNDLNKYMVKKENFLDHLNWHKSSENIDVINQIGKLLISSQTKSKSYISFLEKNNSFSVLPNEIIRALPEETIELELKAKAFGTITANLMLVEYNNVNKIKTHMVEVNKLTRLKFSKETRKIRFAIRISGEGFLSIEDILMERLFEKNTFTSQSKKVISNNKTPKGLKDVKIACIFDEFSMTCFQEQVELITFTPDNWEEVLGKNPPDALIVESAWKGNFGAWEYMIAKYNNQDQSALHSLIKWCNDNDIPTSFWNKEDPIHFEKFIHTAKLFDHIFTTDSNMIAEYKKASKRDTVYALPFSAEPKLHNPIKLDEERINKISFAGSYYANRHEDRKKDMDDMLDIAAEFGLHIYDRNFSRSKGKRTDFSFPERFEDNIIGSLRYDEIGKAYKGYKVMLNVNSVKYSPTMFSRRVFEGLASGTPILSSYSEGVRRIFKDIVMISENESELRENLQAIFNNDTLYRSKSLEGIREVYLNHTYKHRLIYMLEKLGLSVINKEKEVTVVSIIESKEELKKVLSYYQNQTWDKKKLVLFLDLFEGYTDILNEFNTKDINSYVLSYMDHYDRINQLVETEYISYFDSNNFYGENFLLDLMIASEYSQSEIIGKSHYYNIKNNRLNEVNKKNEYIYVNDLNIDAAILQIDIFKGENITNILENFRKNNSLNSYFRKGYRLFSSDKFNFIQNFTSKKKDVSLTNIEI